MSWLSDIILQHNELESPSSFWYWSALAAVSAILKDNVWFDKQFYNLYPNIYVMLHADSGLKKGPPVSMAKQLVRLVNNTRIISGRSSIQGILKELGNGQTMPGGKINGMKSVAFICASELSSSIVEDKVATTILTDLYDRQYHVGEWQSLLKMESFNLKDPTITMLTATNEAHSEEFFLKKDIQGGYFARTFIIYENKRHATNSLMFPLKNAPDYNKLAEYLIELSRLRGKFEMDLETRTYFDSWYHEFKRLIDEQKFKDPTGTLNRFDDSVLKVAMLISVAQEPSLIIRKEAVEEAIKQCEKLVGNIRRTTLGRGKSEWAQEKALIMEELLKRDNHAITRTQLNKKYWNRANSSEWDNIMISMRDAGIIEIKQVGKELMYEMPEKIVHELEEHLRGK